MSKKKTSTTTMTLKDFHGGNIPSELPLPSAPGVSARPPDRAAAAAILPDQLRSRPGSGGGGGGLLSSVDRPPAILSQPARIGRHFDEDEGTPFDGQRRPAPAPAQASAAPSARVMRKELQPAASVAQLPSLVWSASQIAQASAVEKVISGQWHSKPALQRPPPPSLNASAPLHDVEEVKRPKSVGYSSAPSAARDSMPHVLVEGRETAVAMARPASHEGITVEAMEHPRLKLLPRSRPLEAVVPPEFHAVEEKQVMVQNLPLSNVKPNVSHDLSEGTKAGQDVAEDENQATERPRLILKPRSAPVQSEENLQKERQSVFGGARPRELVLKERGVDVIAASPDTGIPKNRVTPKVSSKMEAAMNIPGEKYENPSGHQRATVAARHVERKDYLHGTGGIDKPEAFQRLSYTRDAEKPYIQPRPEPDTWRKSVQPPVDNETQPAPAPGPRVGKGASSLELAQAFSKLTTVTAVPSRSRLAVIPNQRVDPAQEDPVMVTRITDTTVRRPQGYSGTTTHWRVNGF